MIGRSKAMATLAVAATLVSGLAGPASLARNTIRGASLARQNQGRARKSRTEADNSRDAT